MQHFILFPYSVCCRKKTRKQRLAADGLCVRYPVFVPGEYLADFCDISEAAVLAAAAGYGTARLLWNCRRRAKAETKYLYDVTLQKGTKKILLKGLLDSGNQLTDPLTDRPVHITDYNEICRLLSEAEIQELDGFLDMELCGQGDALFRYIPYHSVGEGRGILPAITLDSMEIKHGESAWNTKRVLVAVSRRAVSSGGKYQMILHPRILE